LAGLLTPPTQAQQRVLARKDVARIQNVINNHTMNIQICKSTLCHWTALR